MLEEVFLSENFGRPADGRARRSRGSPRRSSSRRRRRSHLCSDRGRTTGTGPSRRSAASRRRRWSWPASRPAVGSTGRPTVSAQGARPSARAQRGRSGSPAGSSLARRSRARAAPVATTAAQSGMHPAGPSHSGRPATVAAPTAARRRRTAGESVPARPVPTGGLRRPAGRGDGAALPRDAAGGPADRWRRSGRVSATRSSAVGTTVTTTVTPIGDALGRMAPDGLVGAFGRGPEQHRPCDALGDSGSVAARDRRNWCAGPAGELGFPPSKRPFRRNCRLIFQYSVLWPTRRYMVAAEGVTVVSGVWAPGGMPHCQRTIPVEDHGGVDARMG